MSRKRTLPPQQIDRESIGRTLAKQLCEELCPNPFDMAKPLDIIDVKIIRGCGLVVTFSDGTTTTYPTDELAHLRPYREPAKAVDSN